MVPLAGIEPALLAESDFESDASTSSAIGATQGCVRNKYPPCKSGLQGTGPAAGHTASGAAKCANSLVTRS